MIYNVIIVGKAGIPIFEKEFVHNAKIKSGKILAGLITTMNSRWLDVIGAPCTYLELDTLSLAVVTNKKYEISCLLVYQKTNGEEFGKLIATELIESFCQEYGEQLESTGQNKGRLKFGVQTNVFDNFESKIGPAIKNSLTPILEFLQTQKEINLAMLISADQTLPHNHRVDAISFVSEYRSLMFQTRQIMSYMNEIDNECVIDVDTQSVIIRKIDNASLIVTTAKDSDHKTCMKLINKYAHVLSSVLQVTSSLGNIANDALYVI